MENTIREKKVITLDEAIDLIFYELYKEKTSKVQEEVSKLEKKIKFYKNQTEESIHARVMQIDDKTAFEKGLYESVKSYLEKTSSTFLSLSKEEQDMRINERIATDMQYATSSNQQDFQYVIDNYRKRQEQIELSKWRKYSSLSEQEETEYLTIFEEYKDKEAKIGSRIEAIELAYNKVGMSIPPFLKDEMSIIAIHKAAKKEARKIISVEEQNETEKSVTSKIASKIKNGITQFSKNTKTAIEIIIGSVAIGAIAAMGIDNVTDSLPMAYLTFSVTTPTLIAAASAIYNKLINESEAESIKNAKDLGIFSIKVELEEWKKKYHDYDKMLTDRTAEKKGGIHV